MNKHITVLKNETVDYLNIKKGGHYLDLTLGGGGHSLEILEREKDLTLTVVDLDTKAIENFESEIAKQKLGSKVTMLNTNFSELNLIKEKSGVSAFDGILADLGWSTNQLDAVEGMSFENKDDALDMRFNKDYFNVKASDLLNALGRRELKIMFEKYADIYGKMNNELVELIVKKRKSNKFELVSDLMNLLDEFFIKNRNFKKDIGFYARVFQALRISVNMELSSLETLLSNLENMLVKNGRFVVITFHSGESKMIESFFKKNEKFKFVINQNGILYIRPGVTELRDNISSRSAKLYVLEKI